MELSQRIANAFQKHNESLAKFAGRIAKMYRRMQDASTEASQCVHVVAHAHPNFRQFLCFEEIKTYGELEEKSQRIQQTFLTRCSLQ